MQIIIDYNGNTYKSKVEKTVTPDQAFDAIYEELENMQKLNLELEGGGRLIMAREALQRAVFRVIP